MLYIYPYNMTSRTAKLLARQLGIRRIKRENSRYRGRAGDTIINWGASVITIPNIRILNPPNIVNLLSNKLSFFNAMEGYDVTPPFTTNKEDVKTWIRSRYKAVARNLLNASGGRGIEILRTITEVDASTAPLFVKYMKKKEEYRFHIMNGEVIAANRKARVHAHDNPNWEIRNHDNGFIYSRDGFDIPRAVSTLVQDSINALNEVTQNQLCFGALDVIWNRGNGRAYLLEINTAPGLEGSLLETYAEAFRRYLR